MRRLTRNKGISGLRHRKKVKMRLRATCFVLAVWMAVLAFAAVDSLVDAILKFIGV
jgi:hypothetical protein